MKRTLVSNVCSNIVDSFIFYKKNLGSKKIHSITNHNRKPQCGAAVYRFVGSTTTVTDNTILNSHMTTSSLKPNLWVWAISYFICGNAIKLMFIQHLLLLLYHRSYLKLQQFASLSVIRGWFHQRSINNIPYPCFSLERNFKIEIHISTFSHQNWPIIIQVCPLSSIL